MARPTKEQQAERESLAAEGLARCRKCDVVKSLDDFGFHKGRRRTMCKPCTNAEVAAYNERYAAADPEGWRERKRESVRRWRGRAEPDHLSALWRKHNLRKLYGINVEEYEALLAEQEGRCAICRRGEDELVACTGRVLKLHVDHDHATGKIRGLLCSWCNPALGGFQEDPRLLRRAIRYLEAHRSP